MSHAYWKLYHITQFQNEVVSRFSQSVFLSFWLLETAKLKLTSVKAASSSFKSAVGTSTLMASNTAVGTQKSGNPSLGPSSSKPPDLAMGKHQLDTIHREQFQSALGQLLKTSAGSVLLV